MFPICFRTKLKSGGMWSCIRRILPAFLHHQENNGHLHLRWLFEHNGSETEVDLKQKLLELVPSNSTSTLNSSTSLPFLKKCKEVEEKEVFCLS